MSVREPRDATQAAGILPLAVLWLDPARCMGLSDSWYRNAVVYAIDVKSYLDSDGDGVGDFRGLTSQLDHLDRLGIDCVWLLPFYESPDRDNGYDVSDHYSVDARLGTPGDVVEFLREARCRGIRVLVDLVVNHTSDQHPWFQSARSSPRSPHRDYYVWSSRPPAHAPRPVFPGQTTSTWTWDDRAGAYYFHHFYSFEPGLNLANPEVREQIKRIMGFWLELGVDGFRIDAAPFLVRPKLGDAPHDGHALLKQLHRVAMRRRAGAVLLAEANVVPWRKLTAYFGEGDEMQWLFNFPSASHTCWALASRSVKPLTQLAALAQLKPDDGGWLNFLRNLDELDLEHLPPEGKAAVFGAFAPEAEMRIYGRGIRRRLAPMLGGDTPRLRLAMSILFSLPGTPLIAYGDEIGIGDDLAVPGRDAVRVPMQWSDERNAGFSEAPAASLVRPVVTNGPFGYSHVNVLRQRRDPESLLAFVTRLIGARKQCPELGLGEYRLLPAGARSVLTARAEWQGGVCLIFNNLTAETQLIVPDLWSDSTAGLAEVFADRAYDAVSRVPSPEIELGPLGFRWFRVGGVQREGYP